MGGIECSIEVDVPAEQAYEQWAEFHTYDRFVENVERVARTGDSLHWVVRVGPVTREWDAHVVADERGKRIAWVAPEGPIDTDIRFEPLGPDRTRVVFRERMHDSALATALAASGLGDRRARADLARFKEIVESRVASGGAAVERATSSERNST